MLEWSGEFSLVSHGIRAQVYYRTLPHSVPILNTLISAQIYTAASALFSFKLPQALHLASSSNLASLALEEAAAISGLITQQWQQDQVVQHHRLEDLEMIMLPWSV
jgi:hypothetical protein